MTDTLIDLAAIKAQAQAASKGPWRVRSGAEVVNGGTIGSRVAHGFSVAAHGANRNADAEYIATMDPPTTLALVAEVERLTVEHTRLRAVAEEVVDRVLPPEGSVIRNRYVERLRDTLAEEPR